MSSDQQKHSVSVAGIVLDPAGRALLIQRRDNSHWEPPGGVLELAESFHHGLCREVKEETGLDVEPIALTGIYKNMVRGVVALVFRCAMTGGELSINNEVSGFHWATPDDVISMAAEAFAVRVLDALHNGVPTVRQYNGTKILGDR
ncbi:NUDIX hydrolase [Nonomuraea sp. NPDC049709]|uniref:NUDIX hydrolase n=1 Tax=Nonomuraea sp. NPDC049709 TaxID=3154736 RepID=UPI00341F38E6